MWTEAGETICTQDGKEALALPHQNFSTCHSPPPPPKPHCVTFSFCSQVGSCHKSRAVDYVDWLLLD